MLHLFVHVNLSAFINLTFLKKASWRFVPGFRKMIHRKSQKHSKLFVFHTTRIEDKVAVNHLITQNLCSVKSKCEIMPSAYSCEALNFERNIRDKEVGIISMLLVSLTSLSNRPWCTPCRKYGAHHSRVSYSHLRYLLTVTSYIPYWHLCSVGRLSCQRNRLRNPIDILAFA